MKIAFSNKYEKQFDRLTDTKIRRQVVAALKSIIDAQRLEEIPSIKKIKRFHQRVPGAQWPVPQWPYRQHPQLALDRYLRKQMDMLVLKSCLIER